MPKRYKVFDLVVQSDIPLPEADVVDTEDDFAVPDVRILKGPLSIDPSKSPHTQYFGAAKKWWFCRQTPQLVLFNAKPACFEIRNGNTIVAQPQPGADDESVRVFIMGSCFGILQMQRGRIPIHGGALEVNGQALVVTGDSGAGKSTAVSAMVDAGYRYLTDDVAPVVVNDDGVFVLPGYPQRKLCADVCTAFGISPQGLPVIDEERQKYAIRNRAEWHDTPLRFGWLVELVPDEACGDYRAERVAGGESLGVLLHNLYRNYVQLGFGVEPAQMKQLLRIASQIKVYRLRRPMGPIEPEKLVGSLVGLAGEEKWQETQK